MMNVFTRFFFALALVLCAGACSDTPDGRTGSETHWLSCEMTSDCNDGFVCSGGRCLPEDEAGTNNNGASNNAATNNANNAATNNVNNVSTNNLNNVVLNNVDVNNETNNGTNNVTNNQTNLCPETAQPIPVDVDPVHEVTFELTNIYATDVWIPSRGWFCDPWGIEELNLSSGFRCGCECPNPGPPGVETYQKVAVGETVTRTWDGRRLVTYTECVECVPDWDRPPVYETAGVLQPADAGSYTFTVPVNVTLPSSCADNGDGTATCGTDQDPLGQLPGEVQDTCPLEGGGAFSQVQFALPSPNDPPESFVVPLDIP